MKHLKGCFLILLIINSLHLIRAQKSDSGNGIKIGEGFTFTSQDTAFSLRFRFRMQSLVAHKVFDDGATDTEMRVKRLRLRFEGFAFAPQLRYLIQLGTTQYDTDDGTGRASIVRDALVSCVPNSHWNIAFG